MIKEQNIILEDWDNLIVLDACRFDFFKNVYKDYLDGKLDKRISKGSSTGEWLVKTFPNKYDYTYISANPYINSYGIPLNKLHLAHKNKSWNAIEHFSKIIDVWKFGWNRKINTVNPEEVNRAYLSNKDNKKTIIHYMQPHYPYLSYNGFHESRNIVKRLKFHLNYFLDNNVFHSRLRPLILTRILKLFRPRSREQLSGFKSLYIEIGMEKLQYYYEDNLRIVLRYVSKLIQELNGRTIITADHGEAFGEQGMWEHPIETHIPVLIEVPWLEVKS